MFKVLREHKVEAPCDHRQRGLALPREATQQLVLVLSYTVPSRNSLLIRAYSFVVLFSILSLNLNWLPLLYTNCRPSLWSLTQNQTQFPFSHLLLPFPSNMPFILTVSKRIWGSTPYGTVVCLSDYLKDQILSSPLISNTGLFLPWTSLKCTFFFNFRWKTHRSDESKQHLSLYIEDVLKTLIFSFQSNIKDNVSQEML